VTDAWVDFNTDHYYALLRVQTQSDKEMRLKYKTWIFDLARCRQPWLKLQAAQNRTKTIESRRESFAVLETYLGRAAFTQGQMPLAVPLWRFREGRPSEEIKLSKSPGSFLLFLQKLPGA
jgi:hypothetical protein